MNNRLNSLPLWRNNAAGNQLVCFSFAYRMVEIVQPAGSNLQRRDVTVTLNRYETRPSRGFAFCEHAAAIITDQESTACSAPY
ncbi:MAG: hypothetical protein CMJ25_29235 [Phycisphaerae bacterium]|nr:hypothetical protein [Phycisphaerae bacterium]